MISRMIAIANSTTRSRRRRRREKIKRVNIHGGERSARTGQSSDRDRAGSSGDHRAHNPRCGSYNLQRLAHP